MGQYSRLCESDQKLTVHSPCPPSLAGGSMRRHSNTVIKPLSMDIHTFNNHKTNMRGVKSVAATMNWGVHTKPALDEMEAEMGVGAPKHRPCPFRLLMCSLKYVLPIVVKWNIEWLGWLGGRAQKLGCWRSSLLRRRGPTYYRPDLQSSANNHSRSLQRQIRWVEVDQAWERWCWGWWWWWGGGGWVIDQQLKWWLL